MIDEKALADTRHLMLTLRVAMRDPALSGGCSLLADLFTVFAEENAVRPLLEATPGWKIPALLLSAALFFRAGKNPSHPLAPYLPGADRPIDAAFPAAVRKAVTSEQAELLLLMSHHTYQCNPPRRLAISLVVAAAYTDDWAPALQVDLGTASGIGLLLGRVQVGNTLGPSDADLKFPLDLRGAPLNLSALDYPRFEKSIGIDLDPPNLRDPECLAWMRACQFPVTAELAYFDQAVNLVLASQHRIERGPATDLLPSIVRMMPAGQPLIVTDTYMGVFMSEEERELLRCELDTIAQIRPVIWITVNPLVPAGQTPTHTTAGTRIPAELIERNRHELFGTVCVTTWPDGKRTPRLVGISHPGGCWLEWRPDFAALSD